MRRASTSRMATPHSASHTPCLRCATGTATTAWRKAASRRRQPVTLCAAGGDQRQIVQRRKILGHQVYPQLRHAQCAAGPNASVIEPLGHFGQHRPQVVERGVVDDEPGTQDHRHQGDAETVKSQQQGPHQRAEMRSSLLRHEELHRPDDHQPGNGQGQSNRLARAVDDQRARREVDRAQQQQVDRQGSQSQACRERVHRRIFRAGDLRGASCGTGGDYFFTAPSSQVCTTQPTLASERAEQRSGKSASVCQGA